MENKETMYHIGLSKKDVKGAKYAILTGDPGRVSKIAKYLKKKELLKVQREYTSYLGELSGEKVLVISTGMGGPSAAICVEELAQIGLESLVRIGTCGGMQLDVDAGDIVIAQASIRQEGTSKEYVPVEFPATADFDLTYALKQAAEELEYTNHVGIVHCKDSFYGQHSPHRMPIAKELENNWNAWIKAGALASEMETASIFTVSRILKMKAAAVLLTVWNQEKEKLGLPQDRTFDTECAIKVAVKAIENEIMRSKKNGQNKK